MLPAFLALSATVASAATLDRRLKFTPEEIKHRLESGGNHAIGDACHPSWNYDTCNTETIQPPCGLEQGLTSRCEIQTNGHRPDATDEQRKAYRDCLYGDGSSLLSVINACLDCKVANGWYDSQSADHLKAAFKSGSVRLMEGNGKMTAWDATQAFIKWELVKLTQPDANAPRVPVEKYWKDPVYQVQTGKYTLNGTTFGGELDCQEPCPEEDQPQGSNSTSTSAPAQAPAVVEAPDVLGHNEKDVVSIKGKNQTVELYKTSKHVLGFTGTKFTVYSYVSITLGGVLDPSVNGEAVINMGEEHCAKCPPVRPVANIISAPPSSSTDTAAAKSLMEKLPAAPAEPGPIDNLDKTAALQSAMQQDPTFQDPPIPKDIPQGRPGSAGTACQPKKRARHLRV